MNLSPKVKAGECEFPHVLKPGTPLAVGFLPVSDCAPLVYAQESGLFEKYELRVELRRETRWAELRDQVFRGELAAAHAPVTLPFLANLALDSDRCACVSGLVLSLQGCAITIARPLWEEGVRDAAALRDLIYRDWGRRTYTFGVVFPYSPPSFLLRQWLRSGGISPQSEVRLVVVPPAEMFPMLKLGYLDGFCAGEPWPSVAVESGAGVAVATSAGLSPLHPEKVLMVRRDFAERRAEEHERLIAAVLEACMFCDRPEHHSVLSGMLAQPHYVNAPEGILKSSLAGGLNVFHRHYANDPSNDKAAWTIGHLEMLLEEILGAIPPLNRTPMLKNVFRRDIYLNARAALFRQTRAIELEVNSFMAAK